jgi:16S rRNA (cytosine1402-N4)-methyltransferase
MTAFVHIPVLAGEVLAYLHPRPGGVYCDGTVGGGGHSRAILESSSPDGRLIGIDRDPGALAAARARLAEFGDRVTLVHGRFGDIEEILGTLGQTALDGMVLDIGPSSPQFDQPARGFSFQKPGPIDMRMDPTTGPTALDLMRAWTPAELARVLRDHGEEPYSKRIAARIKEALRKDQLHTTTELAALVEGAMPAPARRRMKIHPATRTFQALRIAVNGELDQLARFLDRFPALLAPHGRCVVISFHSLEDRLVKRRFRDLSWTSSLPPALARQAGERTEPVCVPLTRKPVMPSSEEVARNPRARSARLRACEKVAA